MARQSDGRDEPASEIFFLFRLTVGVLFARLAEGVLTKGKKKGNSSWGE